MDKQQDQANKEENTLKKHEAVSLLKVMLTSFTSLWFLSLFILMLLAIKNFNLLILFLLCLIIASVLVTYTQFGKHSVSSDVKHIYIKKGIFKPNHYTIPIDQINGIVIKSSFPRRLFNFVKIEIFYSTDSFKSTKIMLFPLIKKNRFHTFLLDTMRESQMTESLRSIPKQAVFINLVQPSYSLIIITFFIFFFWPEYWFIPLVYFLSFVIYRLLKTRWTKYHLEAQWIQLQTGVFSTETLIMKHGSIDSLSMSQSWLQQKFRLATVYVYTRSTPTHLSRLEHIPVQTARELVEWHQVKDHNKHN